MTLAEPTVLAEAVHILTSGGEQADGQPVPALYATKAQAIAAYDREKRAFIDALPVDARWRIIDEPVADKFKITLMDERGRHRMAEDRWSVMAKIGVSREH